MILIIKKFLGILIIAIGVLLTIGLVITFIDLITEFHEFTSYFLGQLMGVILVAAFIMAFFYSGRLLFKSGMRRTEYQENSENETLIDSNI